MIKLPSWLWFHACQYYLKQLSIKMLLILEGKLFKVEAQRLTLGSLGQMEEHFTLAFLASFSLMEK